jgi:Fur family ferric uptake transcriptional regulator
MSRTDAASRTTRGAPHGLQRHCARWTGPREDVFNLLVRTQQHLTAKEIFATLRRGNPALGLATVYRTLDLLRTAGLVRRLSWQAGDVRYEYRRADRSDHHHHLICTACGRIVNYRDFETEELQLVRKTEQRLEQQHGYLIRDHNIEFLGLCGACRPGGTRPLGRAGARPRRPVSRGGRHRPAAPRKEAP